MQITVTSTKEIVHMNGAPARAWTGKTSEGVPVVAYITCVQVEEKEDLSELDRDLIRNPLVIAPAQAVALDQIARGDTNA